jgi:hypothetical protein
MSREAPRLIAVTRVRTGREAEFEAFVRDVVTPAAERMKPHLADQWQLVRPAKHPPSDAAAPAYLFLFYGDAPYDEWDLEDVLPAAYGEDDGRRHLQALEEMIDGEQTVFAVEPVS